jgi:predicted CXXCH cytochrome family protein
MKRWIIISCIFLSILTVGVYFDSRDISYAIEPVISNEEPTAPRETTTSVLISGILTLVPESANTIDITEIREDGTEIFIETITPELDGSWTFSKSFTEIGEYSFKFLDTNSSTATVSIVIDREGEQYISRIHKELESSFGSFELITFNVPIGRSNSCNSCHNLHVSHDPDYLRNDTAISSIAQCILDLLPQPTSP